MKRFLTILLILLIPGMLHAQVKDTDSFFKEYSGVKGYKSVYMSQKMLEMSVGTDNPVIKDIEKIRFITSESSDSAMIQKIMKVAEADYELLSINDDSGDVTSFYLHDSKPGKKSFLMIAVRKERDMVMEITGNFNIKDISSLSQLSDQK